MQNGLEQYKRNINQLFGTCVEILNVGRSLQQLSLSMQILANNGVVQAARISGGKGRPMLALVEILSNIPKEIRPEVKHIEDLCATLARLTASSSSIIWRYHQLVASLLFVVSESSQANKTESPDLSRLQFISQEDLVLLVRHPSLAAAQGLERHNYAYIAELCGSDLTHLHAELTAALRCLEQTHQALNGLKTIGLTVRYMAFCIASEAAGLAEAEANFKTLAMEISEVVDDLDTKMKAMRGSIDHGCEVLSSLLKGHIYAE